MSKPVELLQNLKKYFFFRSRKICRFVLPCRKIESCKSSKSALPKFRADRSYVRGLNGRSKFLFADVLPKTCSTHRNTKLTMKPGRLTNAAVRTPMTFDDTSTNNAAGATLELNNPRYPVVKARRCKFNHRLTHASL